MPDYAKLAKGALASIKKAGRVYPMTRQTREFNNGTGQVVETTTQSGEIAGVKLPARKGSVEGFDKIFERETFVKTSIVFMIAAAQGATFEPDLLDVLTIDDQTWEIRGVGTLAPAGIPLIYNLGLVKR
jgi:hypothetical protein